MSKFIKYDSTLTDVTAFSGNFDHRELSGRPEFTDSNTYTTVTLREYETTFPLITGSDSTFGTGSSWTSIATPGTDPVTVTFDYDSGDLNHTSVMRVQTNIANNTTTLGLGHAQMAINPLVGSTLPILGHTYRFTFDYKWISRADTAGGYTRWGGDPSPGMTGAVGQWNSYETHFTVVDADGFDLVIFLDSANGAVTDEILIDNAQIVDLHTSTLTSKLSGNFSESRTFEGYNFDSVQGVMLSTVGNIDIFKPGHSIGPLSTVTTLPYLCGGATIDPALSGYFLTTGTSAGTYTLNNYNSMSVAFPTITATGIIDVVPINAAGFTTLSKDINTTITIN